MRYDNLDTGLELLRSHRQEGMTCSAKSLARKNVNRVDLAFERHLPPVQFPVRNAPDQQRIGDPDSDFL